jgi:putative transposase
LLLKALVHSANVQDRDGAKLVLKGIKRHHRLLARIWADGAYGGELIAWVKRLTGIELTIVKRGDDQSGFTVIPKRWVSERTFGWFNRFRRLSKDYEANTDNSESMIYTAMIHLMLRRLCPC